MEVLRSTRTSSDGPVPGSRERAAWQNKWLEESQVESEDGDTNQGVATQELITHIGEQLKMTATRQCVQDGNCHEFSFTLVYDGCVRVFASTLISAYANGWYEDFGTIIN